jgi:hypothetical protein
MKWQFDLLYIISESVSSESTSNETQNIKVQFTTTKYNGSFTLFFCVITDILSRNLMLIKALR